ncbi:unnamed protein product [Absidia cylindrospora]
MWYSVQWVFSSSYNDTTSPAMVPSSSSLTPSSTPSTPITATVNPNNTMPSPSKPVRYERDYTTLIAYPISLLIIYFIYFIFTHYRQFFPDVAIPITITTTPSPISPNISNNGYDRQEEGSNPLDQQQPPPSIAINERQHSTLYLLLRRWWHYEFRCFDNTFRLGTYMTLLALSGLHAIFIFWPFFGNTNDIDTNPFFQHQLISNRIAQLALVDMAVVVGLSVHTSIIWRLIGLHNSSMTLPWHRWFARFSVFGVIYHGCFQWTKHYYRHHLAESPHQLDSLLLGYSTDGNVSDFEQTGVFLSSVTWWDLLVSNPRYLSGTCMVLCLLVLFLGSHPLVREKWYRLFRLTHVVSFLGVVVMGMWHHWAFAVFYVAVVGVWLVDIIARWRSMRVAPVVALDVVADQVVKLQVVLEPPRRSSCRCRQPSQARQRSRLPLLPGQFVFCSFSGTKWKDILWSHPFSISRVDALENSPTESSDKQMLTFFIKVYGKQTKALYNKANIKEKWPTVRLGSPLGHVASNCHWTDIYGLYPVVVLIAEGIGITPWMSVFHSLAMMNSNHGNGKATVKHLNLIWTVRDGNMIKPFINDIEEMMSAATTATKSNENGDDDSLFHVDWHIYVTGSSRSHLDEEQQPGMTSSSTMAGSNTSQQHDRNCHYQYHQGRPNYTTLLESIRLKHDDKDVALGICAHEESATVCSNLARSARFSHANAYWNIRLEWFDL